MKLRNIVSALVGWLCVFSVGTMAQRTINDLLSEDCIQLGAGEDPRDFVLKLPVPSNSSNSTDDVIVSPAQLNNTDGSSSLPVVEDQVATPISPGNNNSSNIFIPDGVLEPCFTVVGETDQMYRLTVRTYDYDTRFSLSERPIDGFAQGYAWGGTADGIYYCIQGTAKFDFLDEPSIASFLNESRPVGSKVTISSEAVANGTICNSDYIGFDGVITPPSDPNNNTPPPGYIPPSYNGPEVFWADHRYFLKATHFEYMVAGEEAPVSMKGATDIEIRSDPGSESYHSIEITWYQKEGKEKRLYMYVNADEQQIWNISEVRVYNDQQDWEYFYPTDWQLPKETCFKKDRFVLTNDKGSQIVWANLSLATFRPWGDEEAYLECIDGMKVVLPEGTTDARAAVTTLIKPLGVMPSQIDAFIDENKEDGRIQAFISARDRNELCLFHQRINAATGNPIVEVVASAVYPSKCIEVVAGLGGDDDDEVDSPSATISNRLSMVLVSLFGLLML